MTDTIVLDTNVRIAAFFWHGAANKCWTAVKAGLVEVAYCPEMVTEFTEKLYGKFALSADDVRAAVYDLRRFGRKVEISGNLRVVIDDPDDDMFIECALVAGATMIVSGVRHLLEMGGYQDIRIVPLSDFLAWLAKNV